MPPRSRLAQERSRDTRQSIIRAALELWAERGYATGIDDTKAEEIAARAGVSKATFYLHFARKDDILLETGWMTTKVFYEDTLKALVEGGTADAVIDTVTVRLCRRMDKVPRPVLRRILRAQLNSAGPGSAASQPERDGNGERYGFQPGFALIFLQAQQDGGLPQAITAASLAAMFEAMLYSSLREWAYDESASLLTMLRERFAVLLAGARAVSPGALGGD